MISIDIRDQATPALRQLAGELEPGRRRALLLVLGRALEGDLRQHFAARGAEPNQRGWPRTFFWTREVRARTALASVTPDAATVAIGSPALAHKVSGGEIRPGPGKRFLTIPLRAEVYGKRASAQPVPGLFVLRGGRGLFLAAREGRALRLFYRLVRAVRQAPDPRALPARETLAARAVERATQWLARRRSGEPRA